MMLELDGYKKELMITASGSIDSNNIIEKLKGIETTLLDYLLVLPHQIIQ